MASQKATVQTVEASIHAIETHINEILQQTNMNETSITGSAVQDMSIESAKDVSVISEHTDIASQKAAFQTVEASSPVTETHISAEILQQTNMNEASITGSAAQDMSIENAKDVSVISEHTEMTSQKATVQTVEASIHAIESHINEILQQTNMNETSITGAAVQDMSIKSAKDVSVISEHTEVASQKATVETVEASPPAAEAHISAEILQQTNITEENERFEDACADILKRFPTFKHFKMFAQAGTGLALSINEISTIIEDNASSVENQKFEMLQLWKKKNGSNATSRYIREVVEKHFEAENGGVTGSRIEDAFLEVPKVFANAAQFKRFALSRKGLSLSMLEVENIKDNARSVEERNLCMLTQWKYKNGESATTEKIWQLVDGYLNDEPDQVTQRVQQQQQQHQAQVGNVNTMQASGMSQGWVQMGQATAAQSGMGSSTRMAPTGVNQTGMGVGEIAPQSGMQNQGRMPMQPAQGMSFIARQRLARSLNQETITPIDMIPPYPRLGMIPPHPLLESLEFYSQRSVRVDRSAPQQAKINICRESCDIVIKWESQGFVEHFNVQKFCDDEMLGDRLRTEEPYLRIESPDPTKYYHVEVHAWNSSEGFTFTIASEKLRICEEIDKSVLLDKSRPLRKGYKVYEGYLAGASPKLEKVSIKLLHVVDQDRLHREIENNQKLVCHPNTVLYRKSGKLDGIGGQSVYIVVELCDTETLWELVLNRLLGVDRKGVFKQIMQGLCHIHSKKIAYRDLNPQNILLSQDKKCIKIADFGLSKEIIRDKSKFSKSGREIGTDGWRSPEHYKGNTMSYKSDIYSAGLVFYFILSDGKHVFGDNEYLWKTRIIGNADPLLSGITGMDAELAKDLIKKMISFNADSRLTGDKVLLHPYFWEANKKLDFLNEVKKYLYSKKPDGIREHIIGTIRKNSRIFMHSDTGKWHGWFWTIQQNWSRMTPEALSELESRANGGFQEKTYYHFCPIDLIRFIRNTDQHFQGNQNLETMLKSREDVWNLFYDLFPKLFCVVYNAFSDRMSSATRADFPTDLQNYF